MALTNDLVSKFAKLVTTNVPGQNETTVKGTIKEIDGVKYAQFDGSEMLTPVSSTATISDGDRVNILLKNHSAMVTGNATDPSASSWKVGLLDGKFDNLAAKNIDVDNLTAEVAKISTLKADDAIIQNIQSTAITSDYIEAAVAEIGYIKTNELSAEVAKISTLTADDAIIKNIQSTAINADYIRTAVADVGYITADDAVIKGKLDANMANIDHANIDKSQIGLLFLEMGLIDNATIVDGHITGFLDAVEINANNITAGTLIADRILLKGSESGLLYALNNLGELTSTAVNTLDGTILTQRTVTADKLVAKSITTDELDVTNIFGDSAVLTTLTSQQAFINAISTNEVVVGAYDKAQGIIDNIYTPNTTTIDGGKITTGSITANKIDVDNLVSLSANIGGFSFYQGNMEYVEHDRVGYNDATSWHDFLEFNYISTSLKAIAYASSTEKLLYVGAHPELYTTIMVGDDGWVKDEYMTYPFYVTVRGYLHSEEGDIAGFSFDKDGFYSPYNDAGKVINRFVLKCNERYAEPGTPFMGLQYQNGEFGLFYVKTSGIGHFVGLDVEEDIWANYITADYICEGEVPLAEKYAAKSHTHTKSQITDFPTALSSFSNDSGYITASGSCNYANSAGSANNLTTYASDCIDNVEGLKNIFDYVPKSVGTAVRLQHGSHSMAFGWFLEGYAKSNAYGGWFISDYGSPSWVGVNNGSWHSANFITSNNIAYQSVSNADTVDGFHASQLVPQASTYTAPTSTHGNTTTGYILFPAIGMAIQWSTRTWVGPLSRAWNTLYLEAESSGITPPNWPVAFTSEPIVTASVRNWSSGGACGVIKSGYVTTPGTPTSKTSPGTWDIWRSGANSGSAAYTISVVGIGKY